jgi:hypothetical protein
MQFRWQCRWSENSIDKLCFVVAVRSVPSIQHFVDSDCLSIRFLFFYSHYALPFSIAGAPGTCPCTTGSPATYVSDSTILASLRVLCRQVSLQQR